MESEIYLTGQEWYEIAREVRFFMMQEGMQFCMDAETCTYEDCKDSVMSIVEIRITYGENLR